MSFDEAFARFPHLKTEHLILREIKSEKRLSQEKIKVAQK